jgi:hypothetical protein
LIARPIFGPENGDDAFLRNVGSHTDYTALHPRIWLHSWCIVGKKKKRSVTLPTDPSVPNSTVQQHKFSIVKLQETVNDNMEGARLSFPFYLTADIPAITEEGPGKSLSHTEIGNC